MDEHISVTSIMFTCLDPFRFVYVLILTYSKTLVLFYTSTEMSKLFLVSIRLGTKRLSSDTSGGRNGLVPKCLVTRTETPRIPEYTFIFGDALCRHNLLKMQQV